MRLAIHQPNYLPWLGYFYKIFASDELRDPRRCAIYKERLHQPEQGQGPERPPLVDGAGEDQGLVREFDTGDRDRQPREVEREAPSDLGPIHRKAKYHAEVFPVIEGVLAKEQDSLCALNCKLIRCLLERAGIERATRYSSELGLESTGTDRLIDICRALGAETYVSGAGGANYQDEQAFKEAGIELAYSDFTVKEYPQIWGGFVGKLSVLDYVFNCGWDLAGHFRSIKGE